MYICVCVFSVLVCHSLFGNFEVVYSVTTLCIIELLTLQISIHYFQGLLQIVHIEMVEGAHYINLSVEKILPPYVSNTTLYWH